MTEATRQSIRLYNIQQCVRSDISSRIQTKQKLDDVWLSMLTAANVILNFVYYFIGLLADSTALHTVRMFDQSNCKFNDEASGSHHNNRIIAHKILLQLGIRSDTE